MGFREDFAAIKVASSMSKDEPLSRGALPSEVNEQTESGRHAGIDFATTYYYDPNDGAYHIRSILVGDMFRRVGIAFTNELGFMEDEDARGYGAGLARAVIGYVWKVRDLDDHML